MYCLKQLARRTQVPEEYLDRKVWAKVKKTIIGIIKVDALGTVPGTYVLDRRWNVQGRSYAAYTFQDAPRVIEQKLAHARETGRKVRILDTSAGYGLAMQELKAEYGDRVYVVACGLTRPILAKNVDEVRIGLFETQRFREKFDLIFDIFGAVHCGCDIMTTVILRRIIDNLAPDGVAYIAVPYTSPWIPNHYFDFRSGVLCDYSANGRIETERWALSFGSETLRIIRKD